VKPYLILPILCGPLAAQVTIEEAYVQGGPAALKREFVPYPPSADLDREDANFGTALAVHEDLLAVSLLGQFGEGPSEYPGAVHLYRRTPDGWSEFQKLAPIDVTGGLDFGRSLDFSEDGRWLVVGSFDGAQEFFGGTIPSGVYVYRRNDATERYEFVQKLLPGTAANLGSCSISAKVSGDWIAAGCFSDEQMVMYRWDLTRETWIRTQTIEPTTSGGFGFSGFDLSGSNLVIIPDAGTRTANCFHLDASQNRWVFEQAIATGGGSLDSTLALDSGRLLLPSGSPSYLIYERGAPDGQPVTDGSAWSAATNTFALPGRRIVFSGNYVIGVESDFSFDPDTVGGARPTAAPGIWESLNPPFDDSIYRYFALAADAGTIALRGRSDEELAITEVMTLSADAAQLASDVREKLFYEDAPVPDEAAFAYQRRLYEQDGPSQFLTRFEDFETYYGQVNRDNADAAESILRSIYPDSSGAGLVAIEELFLDLAYGRMAAELIRSKNATFQLNQDRIVGASGDLYFLDAEIATIESALAASTAALNAYLPFLDDTLGVPPIEGRAAGRAIFARHVPGRPLLPAQDPAGNFVTGSSTPLLSGYRDLILIYDSLLHHTRTVSELLYLLIARDGPGDAERALALIGDTKRIVFEQRVLLEGLFPDLLADAPLQEELGFDQLTAGIDTALTDLTAFEQNLDGTINLLGYEPGFLMLVQSTGGAFDSFDSFKTALQSTSSTVSRLTNAVDAQAGAQNAIDNYGRTQDALANEWTRLADSSIIPRLFDIVGVNPGEPGYETPQDNVGSEIWQQFQSIEIARLRIQRNRTEISNLRQKISIEQDRRRRESEINSEISDLIIDYGNQQADITETIGEIEAAQAGAEAASSMFSVEKLNPVGIFFSSVNAGVQVGGELAKGQLEAQKERLAAAQDAEIRDKEDQILGENSRALIRTLLLEMRTLAIDSQEAAVLLRQEGGRLTALFCEKANLERRLDEVSDELASRYFADPSHRLRALGATLEADISFEQARQWMFFALRALEYKWNQPVNVESALAPDGFWNVEDLFKLRNAAELQRMFNDVVAWDESDQRFNRQTLPKADWFSIREDYYGYELLDDRTGEPVLYDAVNPLTDVLEENVDAITAFRYELLQLLEDCDDDAAQELCIRFDTVRQNNFQTNTGDYDGDLFNPLEYLDRIETVRVFVKGNHEKLGPNDTSNTVPISLKYAGTSFIRTESPGTQGVSGDRVAGELVGYPTRFYRSIDNRFRFEEGLEAPGINALKIARERDERSDFAVMPLEETPGILPEAIRVFRERSVAATEWTLNIRISEGAFPNNDLDVNEIDDVLLRIDHRAVTR